MKNESSVSLEFRPISIFFLSQLVFTYHFLKVILYFKMPLKKLYAKSSWLTKKNEIVLNSIDSGISYLIRYGLFPFIFALWNGFLGPKVLYNSLLYLRMYMSIKHLCTYKSLLSAYFSWLAAILDIWEHQISYKS